jgi:hypothetical protein
LPAVAVVGTMPTMTGGSDDARTPRDEPNAVDAAWDELIGESDEDDGDSGHADARPVSGSHAAAGPNHRADPNDEMARLMDGEAPKLPTFDEREPTPAAPTPVTPQVAEPTPVTPQATAPTPVKPQAAAPTPAVVLPHEPPARSSRASADDHEPSPKKATTAGAGEPPLAARDRSSRPSLRVVEGAPASARPQGADDRGARASGAADPPVPGPPEPAQARGLPWAWIGLGAVALGAIAYFASRDGAPPSRVEHAGAQAPPQGSARDLPPPPVGSTTRSEGDSSGDAADGTADAGDTGEPRPTTPRAGDPREPPPDTPPEIAAVFRRLPVGPADRPPVGGVGATGIHVDHIAMGSETQGAVCRGRTNDFSVSGGDRAAVCVRVVHPREKEELQVLWQKHGGSTRRSKMVVLPMHAYRTRGYLVLRSEYIGDWTVRILSTDGVELARHDFTVVP